MEEHNKKTENCMICGEELAYLTTAIPVKSPIAGKQNPPIFIARPVIMSAMNAMQAIQ